MKTKNQTEKLKKTIKDFRDMAETWRGYGDFARAGIYDNCADVLEIRFPEARQ